jgi:hypothetical protein
VSHFAATLLMFVNRGGEALFYGITPRALHRRKLTVILIAVTA